MSLYDELQEKVDNTPYSSYFSMWCPFEEHATQAMLVHEDLDKPEGQGRFHCLSCGKGGTHKYLWKKITGNNATTSTPSLAKQQKFLPQWARWERHFGDIETLVMYAHDNVKRFSNMDWYIKKRKLEDVYEPCKLGYLDEWLFLPIFSQQGKVVDVIVRDTKGRSKYIIHSNDEATPLLYVPNWDRAMKARTVYIVYGLIDALALEMCGLPAISGSTGKSLSDKKLAQLNKKYVIVPDKGEESDARNLAMALGNFTKVLRLDYPEGTKDCDEIRMKFGIDYLKNLLTNI